MDARIDRRAFVAAVTVGALGTLTRSGQASIARAVSLSELCAASDGCVVGTAETARSEWTTLGSLRRIVTTTRVRVDRVVAGHAPAELIVRTLGGRVGKIGQIVHGEALLLRHERCLLFVRSVADRVWLVPHNAQGHYPLRARADGRTELVASPRSAELAGAARHGRLAGSELAGARDLIIRAWHDAHP